MKKYRPIIGVVAWIVILSLVGWLLVRSANFAVLSPTGEVAQHQRNLMLFTLGLSLVVVLPVFAMLGLFAWRYREDAKRTYAPEWADSKKLEVIWWGIPILIIAVLSVVTWQTSHSLDPYRAIESTKKPLEVQVVALQWKWLFIYPEQRVATVNNLTIPVDRPVHFSLTADAPMSAFWIPSLGSQIYSMSAMSSQLNLIANKQGTYKGYNTNINGDGYAKMVFDTDVVTENQFDEWTAKHADSGHALNQMHFNELARPSTISSPMYMRLEDQDLYDSIVMKYMKHETTNDSKNPSMDHKGAH